MQTRPEFAHTINGAPGRMFALHKPQAPWADTVFANQSWVSERRPVTGYGKGATLQVSARFDDQCRNGHNTFAITGDIRGPRGKDIASGCLHDDIAQVFPELAHLIAWHLVSTDGPLHYIANTCYLAGDLDCNGLRAGEKRQIINGRSKLPAWHLVGIVDGQETELHALPRYLDATECPSTPEVRYVPWCRVGKGKERQLQAARDCACWPDATDAQLMLPRAELSALLTERLPGLLQRFRADMEAAGFVWAPQVLEVQA